MPGPSNKKKKQKAKKPKESKVDDEILALRVEEAMFKPPFIHDPGNGPRVRDMKAFLGSSFAQPVAEEDALCREYGQKEVLEMLMTVLPEETALILWYNKSRAKSRICPSCLRLYNIGEELEDHTGGVALSGRQLREQGLSGICSPVCFVVAAFDFGEGIQAAWGHTGDEMRVERDEIMGDATLGMVVKMTRLDDLGLLDLCFE